MPYREPPSTRPAWFAHWPPGSTPVVATYRRDPNVKVSAFIEVAAPSGGSRRSGDSLFLDCKPMELLRCPCGFVHDPAAVPHAGWMTLREADSERIAEASLALEGLGATDAAAKALERAMTEAVGELYECPRCARILWRRPGGERYRAYAREPPAS